MREDIATTLLAWYDLHARELPWRVGPADRLAGVSPDPYRVWLSEVMLQQTTVAAVAPYFRNFTTRWPDVGALAAADDAEIMAAWAGLGYYARARNLVTCARQVADDLNGEFPDNSHELQKLAGIGPYTAAAIAAIAFDEAATVVDGNVERVMSRLHAVDTPLPSAKPHLKALAAGHTPERRAGDYAQAVMDLGATICTPRSPRCGVCPIRGQCRAHALGIEADLPKRAPKTSKPVRTGIAYLVQRSDGAWLLERRPAKGLLGGMLGFPTTDWGDSPVADPPLAANWSDRDLEVRHTFTHFHLRLRVLTAFVDRGADPDRGNFVAVRDFRPGDLPTLMRKAYDLASDAVS